MLDSAPYHLLQGDCRDVLKTLPDESVQTCVTSPPYFGLRDYRGGEAEIGQEATPDEYVAALVEVFREVRRVLRKDGTLWIVIGDSYARAGGDGNCGPNASVGNTRKLIQRRNLVPPPGLKPKDLIGIPWMMAFALRADGWWLRSDIIYAKKNPMPESVRDRPTRSHEYVFLLSKSQRYFYDADAIREPMAPASASRYAYAFGGPKSIAIAEANREGIGVRIRPLGRREPSQGRNKRDVWTVSSVAYPEAHFATFPSALIEPCILAGCPVGGAVLDPFAGSGTTLAVALEHGRRAIGIELNPDYIELARKRIDGVQMRMPLEEESA